MASVATGREPPAEPDGRPEPAPERVRGRDDRPVARREPSDDRGQRAVDVHDVEAARGGEPGQAPARRRPDAVGAAEAVHGDRPPPRARPSGRRGRSFTTATSGAAPRRARPMARSTTMRSIPPMSRPLATRSTRGRGHVPTPGRPPATGDRRGPGGGPGGRSRGRRRCRGRPPCRGRPGTACRPSSARRASEGRIAIAVEPLALARRRPATRRWRRATGGGPPQLRRRVRATASVRQARTPIAPARASTAGTSSTTAAPTWTTSRNEASDTMS